MEGKLNARKITQLKTKTSMLESKKFEKTAEVDDFMQEGSEKVEFISETFDKISSKLTKC